MTLPTVPLVDGAFYWVRLRPSDPWTVAVYEDASGRFWVMDIYSSERALEEALAAISGPIPTPDGEGE